MGGEATKQACDRKVQAKMLEENKRKKDQMRK